EVYLIALVELTALSCFPGSIHGHLTIGDELFGGAATVGQTCEFQQLAELDRDCSHDHIARRGRLAHGADTLARIAFRLVPTALRDDECIDPRAVRRTKVL